MGFTTYAEDLVLNAFGQGDTAPFEGPTTHNIGLLTAPVWLGSTGYSLGDYVIPSSFNSITGQTGKIFIATVEGESSGEEPSWPTTPGGTVVDGGVTWTECSLLFDAGTFTGAELAIGTAAYERAAVTGDATNFPDASDADPAVLSNGTVISFPKPTADWGLIVGWIDSDASEGGNIWAWGVTATKIDCAEGSSPSFAIGALTLALTP
jgi:hypothetical protein